MANHTFDNLYNMMMYDDNFPALEQAFNDGADVNMVDPEVDPPNPAAN